MTALVRWEPCPAVPGRRPRPTNSPARSGCCGAAAGTRPAGRSPTGPGGGAPARGPVTLRISDRPDTTAGRRITGTAWGPGADWALKQLPSLLGADDKPAEFRPRHRVVAAAPRKHGGLRLARTELVMEALVPSVLEQRITTGSARYAWRCLLTGTAKSPRAQHRRGCASRLRRPSGGWCPAGSGTGPEPTGPAPPPSSAPAHTPRVWKKPQRCGCRRRWPGHRPLDRRRDSATRPRSARRPAPGRSPPTRPDRLRPHRRPGRHGRTDASASGAVRRAAPPRGPAHPAQRAAAQPAGPPRTPQPQHPPVAPPPRRSAPPDEYTLSLSFLHREVTDLDRLFDATFAPLRGDSSCMSVMP